MTYHARLNLIMLATILGLVIFLYLKPQPYPLQEFRMSSLPVQAVQNIQIVQHDTNIVLKKQQNLWYLVEPMSARADGEKVAQILEILSVTSENRFPLTESHRFGVDQPRIRLQFNHETFDFGELTPVTNQQYVATKDHVLLISPRYAVMLPAHPLQIVSPLLLSETEIPVSFQLDEMTISYHEKQWLINSGQGEQLMTQEEIKRWVELWQQAKARKIIPDSEILDGEQTAGEQNILITLQNGKKVRINVFQVGSELFFRRDGETVGYVLANDAGKMLLDPSYNSNHALVSSEK